MLQVENSWEGLHEVNRVTFDPGQVSVEQMAGWLEKAGTLVRIMERTRAGKEQERGEDGKQ